MSCGRLAIGYAPEQARHETEPSGTSAREPGRPVAGPEGSEQERQRGRLGGEVAPVGDVQRPECAQQRGQGGGGRGKQQTRQPPGEKRDRSGERAPQHGPGPQSRPFRPEQRHGGGQQHVRPWRKEGVVPHAGRRPWRAAGPCRRTRPCPNRGNRREGGSPTPRRSAMMTPARTEARASRSHRFIGTSPNRKSQTFERSAASVGCARHTRPKQFARSQVYREEPMRRKADALITGGPL